MARTRKAKSRAKSKPRAKPKTKTKTKNYGRRMPRAAGYHWRFADAVERPDGLAPCRWCYGPVEPPKRSWCGNARCHWEWNRRTKWSVTRDAVLRRDGYRCTRCGFLARPVWDAFLADVARESDVWRAEAIRSHQTPRVLPPAGLAALYAERTGQPEHVFTQGGPLLQVDHVIPLSRGGEAVRLDNLRTLCCRCHDKKTRVDRFHARLRKRLGARAARIA